MRRDSLPPRRGAASESLKPVYNEAVAGREIVVAFPGDLAGGKITPDSLTDD